MTPPLSSASYLLPPLVVSGVSLILIVVVWRGARSSLASWIFCGLLLSVGVVSLLIFGMRSSPDVQQALLWDRMVAAVGFVSYVLYYHFTLAYTNTRGQRRILLAGYLLVVLFAGLSPTDLLIQEMRTEYYGYAPTLGLLFVPLSVSGLCFMGGGAYNLIKRYRASYSPDERNRIIYLLIAVAFPVLGAFLDTFSNLPPAAIWGNLIFCVICTVAILKYHLLDIRIVVRKSLAYLLVSAIVAIPYVGMLLLVNQVLKGRIAAWWAHALVILLLAIVLRPLYSWAQQLVDRLFYRDRYDYLKALEQFSREAQSVVNLEELGSTIVKLVSGALRSSSACLLLPSAGKGGLVLASSVGLDNPPSGIVLRNQSPLVKWLRLHSDILAFEDLYIVPQLQSLSLREKKSIEKMGANIYVPIKARKGELSGVLVLGQKLSQQTYSNEDKQLLIAVSSQMAMALDNARLYNDAVGARENLETWLNSMSDCVLIINMDYTIRFSNKAATVRFGGKTGEVCWNMLGKDSECPYCPIQSSLLNSKDGSRYTTKVGGREYDVAAAPLLNPDGSTSIIEVLRDITVRKQAEAERRELEQKAQLASRLASVGEMAAGIAHEINNPLTGVIGFADRLMKKNIPEDIRKQVETINESALRVAGIVKRLLTFARQQRAEQVYLSINEIIATTLAMRGYEMETSNIGVAIELAPNLPRTMADVGQLQQLFLNIIINAETEMKLAHGRGSLFIKTETTDNTIRISFKDDGPGIAKENLEKIFDPFFSTRNVGEGTGLGLSVCYGIVTEHNGRIHAESELGKGATLIVELPIVAQEKGVELVEATADEAERVVKARILVVDDEPVILQLLDEELTEQGYEVETVDNVNDILEKIKNERYGLIIMDIKMPGMSGMELYKHIKKIDQSLAKRVIFITGDVMAPDTRDFFSKTKVPYVAKPFDTEQLKRRINTMLTRGM